MDILKFVEIKFYDEMMNVNLLGKGKEYLEFTQLYAQKKIKVTKILHSELSLKKVNDLVKSMRAPSKNDIICIEEENKRSNGCTKDKH